MREVQIRVAPTRHEHTQYLNRESGTANPRSKLGDAVVAVQPGVALVVRVAECVTLLPWSVVESVGWDDPTS